MITSAFLAGILLHPLSWRNVQTSRFKRHMKLNQNSSCFLFLIILYICFIHARNYLFIAGNEVAESSVFGLDNRKLLFNI